MSRRSPRKPIRLTPERWQRVDRLFQWALDLPLGDRAAFLREACRGDARLRREVESLIGSHERAGRFLEVPALPTDCAFAVRSATKAPARPSRTLARGSRLGPYRIEALLGAGGMGQVYRALDTRLGREVALKVLPDALDPGRRARFEREARAVAALNHPNIVTLHSLEERRGLHFLTMELVRGASLDRRIPPSGVAAEALLGYALSLSEALAAAHERGIVHRDLKPGNVMVTDDGRLKLLDFGLATSAAGRRAVAPLDRAGTLTGEGLLLGTCRYMSPEQLRGGPLDCRSDVFALGIVLYELAAGHAPFGGATQAETWAAILQARPPAVGALRPDLPRALADRIMRCLEKDPRRRFADAGEIHRELRAATQAAGAPLGEATATRPTPSVAILPFVNLGARAENEFFADGITADVIAHLSKVRSLKVISRTSARSLKKGQQRLREVRGVRGILEGSVRQVGSRVRVVAQLVDAETHVHLWAETYDRDLVDILAIQAEVARQITAALRAELAPGEREPTRRLRASGRRAGHDVSTRRQADHRVTHLGRCPEPRVRGRAMPAMP